MSHRMATVTNSTETCANCSAPIRPGKAVLYDDHAELHFCDDGCFRDWADDKGAERVLAFYRRMNLHDATY